MKLWIVSMTCVFLAIGCTTSTPADPTMLEISRRDSGLDIVGRDGSGRIVAKVALFRGEVDFAPDVGEPTQRLDGVRLTVQIGTDPELVHVSPAGHELELPVPPLGATRAFLAEPRVIAALRAEGIGLRDATTATAEVDYIQGGATCGIHGCTYTPSATCGATICAADPWGGYGGGAEGQWVCCGNSKNAVERMCTGNPGGSNWCGAVGPAGCAVCWTSSFTYWCEIWNEDVCYMQWT